MHSSVIELAGRVPDGQQPVAPGRHAGERTQDAARYPAPGPVGHGRSRPRPGCDGASRPDGAAEARRPLVPTDEEERTLLQARLIHAGLYGRQAMVIYLGVKILLMIAPALIGLFGGPRGPRGRSPRRARRLGLGRDRDDRPELLARQEEGRPTDRVFAGPCPTPSM